METRRNQRCTGYAERRLPRHPLLRALAEQGLLVEVGPGRWMSKEDAK